MGECVTSTSTLHLRSGLFEFHSLPVSSHIPPILQQGRIISCVVWSPIHNPRCSPFKMAIFEERKLISGAIVLLTLILLAGEHPVNALKCYQTQLNISEPLDEPPLDCPTNAQNNYVACGKFVEPAIGKTTYACLLDYCQVTSLQSSRWHSKDFLFIEPSI